MEEYRKARTGMDKLEEFIRHMPGQVPLQVAVNLFAGRAVPERLVLPDKDESEDWIRVNPHFRGDNGRLFLPAGSLSKAGLYELVQLLPVHHQMLLDTLAEDLYKGDLVGIGIPGGAPIKIQVNPEGKTLDLFSWELRPIQVNLRLDPDWKPRNTKPLRIIKGL